MVEKQLEVSEKLKECADGKASMWTKIRRYYTPVTGSKVSGVKHDYPKPSSRKIFVQPIGTKMTEMVPEVVDQLELIKKLQDESSNQFFYLIYAVERSSPFFTPYSFKIVSYKEISEEYLTISANGVTQYNKSEMIFTPLETWEREYIYYLKLKQIKIFIKYSMWKPFNVWRKYVVCKKYTGAKQQLGKTLFILHPTLRHALLKIQRRCTAFLNSTFIDKSILEKNPLFTFLENQMSILENYRNQLDEFRALALETVNESCFITLEEAGYTVDDSNITIEQTAFGKLGQFGGQKFKMPEDGILKMSYIEQVRKRETCSRLSCFIHLADYMEVTTMHRLLINTYEELLKILESHSKCLPENDILATDTLDVVLKENRPSSIVQSPYFLVDLLISIERGITMDPTEETFRHSINTLKIMWEENLHAIKPLLSDYVLRHFTRPMINRQIQGSLCGLPPNILTIIEQDKKIWESKTRLDEVLQTNFDAVKLYCQRFKGIQELYEDDFNFDENVIRENTKVELFRQWCIRYKEEMEMIRKVVEYQPLGIFFLQLTRFKEAALLAPMGKMRIIESVMPGIGKSRVDALLSEALDAITYLESEPTSTDDYVSYIKFIDKAQQKVDLMEGQLDYVKELYDNMNEFNIQVAPEESANYLGIGVHFTNLRLAVDKKMEEREKLISKFNSQLQKDIAALTEKVAVINEEAQQQWLIDSSSNIDACLETLQELGDRLSDCTVLADEYRAHQKGFRVEITRFEILEHVTNEVKLRSLLWNSKLAWSMTVDEWQTVDFSTLDIEEVTSFTMKTLKSITQLEKGLPPNNVLPGFKEEVDLIRDKLPILGYLRNPNLKQRHWMKIESLLNYRFQSDEVVTLNLLEDLGVFAYPNELMEIAASASSEAGLEAMLKKVEDIWKALEFIILPYKEIKDVYILGSLEEIQTAIDESNINLQTIAASRHVRPIKPRVEEWLSKLYTFTKTLEAWQYCQQQWIYLEAIFSAPDIQRQLPVEAKLYMQVDKSWKEIMRTAARKPQAMDACTQAGLLEQLTENNNKLDQVMKCLEAYLETKRIAFPRFFFLSNDELLEILAQTKNPHAVQRHLQKCFDAIYRLEFATTVQQTGTDGSDALMTTDILAMISPEGERVALGKGLKARGNVEEWLSKVEESMFMSLRLRMKAAISDLQARGRSMFISSHPSQIVLAVSQIFWVRNVHLILESTTNVEKSMASFEQKCYSDLNLLAAMVRGELPRLVRDVVINLITIDVHNRDTISLLVQNKITSSTSFDWAKALRYYWDDEIDNCIARMSNAEYLYGYEYLGASRRLVITPLTDKCYLCLMGALQLDLGGAPAGPAGTGKTETTKDLAKALAIQCVVFNCSEGLDYKMMGRFFSGLATSGAWCCFDEFNRIDIEVLSVIAQQLITIRNAKILRAEEFMFEGRMIKLVMSCAAFITMNPGYAGRTELPDNLKSLFRPFAMMVPDYKLIAEVTLYSEGFESSKSLSKKMTLLYTLCSEQLSQQDHYDFGMRAVKSVLVMAGTLKRNNPDKSEDVVLIRALRDSNIPKFLADDAELFRGIVGDLFPGVIIPDEDYGILEETAIKILQEADLQPEQCTRTKLIQLHETMQVRHGVMLVGPTGSGKTVVLKTLCDTYTRLHELGIQGPAFSKVHMYVLNPKSITIGQLYGEIDLLTNEWHDGLIGVITRLACTFTTDDHQWITCDGPVDAIWIENLNTVLDDNKMLCLANSERIKLTPYIHMVFEVSDLAVASPATVSRCGMVYVDPSELKWLPYVRSWTQKLPEEIITEQSKNVIMELFETYFENGLVFFRKNCDVAIAQVDISKANMACAILESILLEPGTIDKKTDKARAKVFLTQSFIFSLLWSVGGNVLDSSREILQLFVREQFMENSDARLPSGDLWSLYVNCQNKRLDLWVKLMPAFVYDKDMPFFDILVPTVDTVRFSYIMEKLLNVNKPVLFTGATGVGKSVMTKLVLNSLQSTGSWVPINLIFSAQTTSGRTQEILELKLERRKRALLGAPIGKKVCVFVDDVNMPKLETFGAQPPIELLRQILDFGGFYDRDKLFWVDIQNVVFAAACAPPGGGRNPLTTRFIRHFAMLLIPAPTETSLKAIFRAILRGFLQDFVQPVMDAGDKIVNATVDLYNRIAEDLLPTPEKSHYVFNLRDLSKCIQGMMQVDPSVVRETNQILRLFYHECLRVFHDRLINKKDKNYFYRLLTSICEKTFGDSVVSLEVGKDGEDQPPVLLFGDFMSFGAAKENRIYEEIADMTKIKTILQDYLEDYVLTTGKDMKIIFFLDAIEHVCRLARILRSERGNGLLVGVGGMGKQSLTRLASHLNGYRCHQIEVSRGYDLDSWHEDLRRFYFHPGAYADHSTFIFTDTQIVLEEFLEDINNTLNSGEVPNLFESDELEKAIIATRPAAKLAGIEEADRDGIYQFFIARVRNHLHLMICMSPIGDAFRHRCRMFPSLVNCCTIDWYMKWPDDALLSVAESIILPLVPDDNERLLSLSSICVLMHQTVEDTTIRFFEEMRRRYYTTPSSYLQLLKLYRDTITKKTTKILSLKDKISSGLNKLKETNEMIADMKMQLIRMAPKLKTSKDEVTKLVSIVTAQQVECDKVKAVVSADEAAAKVKADETMILEEDARKDLEAAMPAMLEAQKALESLNKNDINEIRVFNQPPNLVRFVMEAVNLLLGEKLDWKTAKLVLSDIHFLERLLAYPKDEISDKLLNKLQAYVTHPDFKPELVAKQSKVCKSMCIWVRAIHGYAKIYRVVEPKRQKLQQAQNELWAIESLLAQKQQQLRDVEAKIHKLQNQYDIAVKNLNRLEYEMALAEARLVRSGQLTSALQNEGVRWQEMMLGFEKSIWNLTGDILVAAGALAYLGAFTNVYRQELLKKWLGTCEELKIDTSPNFSLETILADPYDIRMWNYYGLPRDSVSTDNAILVTQAARWPLMIDPQEQANRWIKNMEQQNNLRICKMNDPNFMRILEACIRIGAPILLQEVGEILDPSLEPVLLKQVFIQSGRPLIRLGDTDVEYDDNFKLYITTKLSNPHYLPEVCIKVTIVNFTVTPKGLEDQLLADVVRLERPDLEEMRNELIGKINADKGQLQAIEDKILTLLYGAGDDILDNVELIETLNNSKETSAIIATRLIDAEETEAEISVAREKYRLVAERGSVLYFVVANLADIDPMYQFSLKYFNQIFTTVIEVTEMERDLQARLRKLINEITLAVYRNVARGLFERHKLVYSFMLNTAIFLNNAIISHAEWNFLLRGAGQILNIKKPDIPTLTDPMWTSINYLAVSFKRFTHIMEDVFKKIKLSVGYFEEEINVIPANTTVATYNWNAMLNDMEKLMLLKSLKEEKLVFAITAYVSKNLGKFFIESPISSIQVVYPDMSHKTPLVFVLTFGSDPLGAFQRFAVEKEFYDRCDSISLGQGQGPIAEGLMMKGVKEGRWIFLQNCHLAASWMVVMESLIMDIIERPEGSVHQDFRLFLSSLPSAAFPVSVLQNSVKVTNEPPKGLKANVRRAFYELNEEFFEDHELDESWKRIIFGVCFFHAIIQERKKFGPLGWNILYEFNDSDRECCLLNLEVFCGSGSIPWDALIYTTGEITYGGRVTDGWDLRCLKTILDIFFSPKTLATDYKYSLSGTYYCPVFDTLNEYRQFIDGFPMMEDPEIFGMHENANITYQLKETQLVLNTIMEVQPKESTSKGEKSSSEIAYEMAEMIMERICIKIDIDTCHPDHLKRDSANRVPSLTTVLIHEVDRYNKLLTKIHSTMENLQRAIKGFVVMSEQLETIFVALLNNQVPQIWHSVNVYPSLKSLGSWIRNLELRTDFIITWLTNCKPVSFWLSGMSFPQGFLTGMQQTYARKYNTPIDQLKLDFIPTDILLDQADIEAAHIVAEKEVKEAYGGLKEQTDGVYIHGLFIDAGKWDFQFKILVDANTGEMNPPLPVFHINPVLVLPDPDPRYVSPLYKTGIRAGVLSTTGHSTNFVVPILLPSAREQAYWILKGTALLIEIMD
ncbi:dynein axonemal heavy chain 6 [Prorops nasuta]|uniref:dynein axonemal heavy chain 6 n=1 Tax=Prorops nasuta TaxID=863751 RepID=UPI0034CEA327